MGKKTRSAGRFGSRYGLTIRQKVANIESKQRKKQKCPYCQRLTIKRIATGIYSCKKCNNKFTGKAYEI